MHQNSQYILHYIHETPYLIPYGQNIVTFRRSMSLNETGVFLWNALEEEKNFEQLLLAFAVYCEAEESDLPQLREDLQAFLQQLRMLGAIDEDPLLNANSLTPAHTHEHAIPYMDLAIGTLRIRLCGEKEYFSDEFTPFAISGADNRTPAASDAYISSDSSTLPSPNPDLTISIHGCTPDKMHAEEIFAGKGHTGKNHTGEVLTGNICIGESILQSAELLVDRLPAKDYLLRFPTMEDIYEAYLSEDGRNAHIYCAPVSSGDTESTKTGSAPASSTQVEAEYTPAASTKIEAGYTKANMAENLFHVIRFLYLYRAQQEGIYAIHSASFLYEGRAWLFSGHSGMGKSTHTNMWHDLLHVPLLNGDLNLISLTKEGEPVVYGLPWCGTSGISTQGTFDLGGIIMLRQAPYDRMEDLAPDEQALRIMHRLISPTWTRKQTREALTFTENLSDRILVKQLSCTKNPSAVTCCKESIDEYLKS